MTAGELFLVGVLGLGIGLESHPVCWNRLFFFNWKVLWLINEDFQKQLQVVPLPLRDKSVATSLMGTNFTGI